MKSRKQISIRAKLTKSKASEPERRCLATGDRTPKFGLLRFVVSPDGEVVPDLAERLSGRGLWLSSDRDALKTAVDKKLFARAAKAEVTVPSDIADRIETMLMKRCQDIIGLARRSDLNNSPQRSQWYKYFCFSAILVGRLFILFSENQCFYQLPAQE